MQFYLGSHQPHWLSFSPVPLFISYRTLSKVKKLPEARLEWALDSGGFTELNLHGQWTISAKKYAKAVEELRKNRVSEKVVKAMRTAMDESK